MLTLTKERLFVVGFIAYLLWSRGPSPAHIAAAVAGVIVFWWIAGPAAKKTVIGSETRA